MVQAIPGKPGIRSKIDRDCIKEDSMGGAVTFSKQLKKWVAYYYNNAVRQWLGTFNTKKAALEAIKSCWDPFRPVCRIRNPENRRGFIVS